MWPLEHQDLLPCFQQCASQHRAVASALALSFLQRLRTRFRARPRPQQVPQVPQVPQVRVMQLVLAQLVQELKQRLVVLEQSA